jgi:uncharacterized membrane protein YcaP (DUF421 family)
MPFTLGHPLLDIAARCVIVYLTLLAGRRLTGKRQVGQLTPFDLLLLLLLANAVQSAMVGSDTSLLGGLIAAATLFTVNAAVARVARSNPTSARFLEGTPTILIRKGDVLEKNLEAEGITQADLLRALREHGIDDTSIVRSAILEVDGSISVLRNDEMPPVPKPHHRIRGLGPRST